MKKEARLRAMKMFLKKGGKITNREIADAVSVNALTIGRWKKEYDWDNELRKANDEKIERSGVVRKKEERDKALAVYLDEFGNITNKELARKVGVSAATISKWKEADNWIEQLASEETEQEEQEIEEFVEEPEKVELEMDKLASPEQIMAINEKIDSLLKREHLSAAEVADLAEAKAQLLAGLETYLAIARDLG